MQRQVWDGRGWWHLWVGTADKNTKRSKCRTKQSLIKITPYLGHPRQQGVQLTWPSPPCPPPQEPQSRRPKSGLRGEKPRTSCPAERGNAGSPGFTTTLIRVSFISFIKNFKAFQEIILKFVDVLEESGLRSHVVSTEHILFIDFFYAATH